MDLFHFAQHTVKNEFIRIDAKSLHSTRKREEGVTG